MKKSHFRQFKPDTIEFVLAHAEWQRSRGRNASEPLLGCTNPRKALKIAKLSRGRINLEEAKKAVNIFHRIAEIHAVEVFGSVARGEEGKDLDLILVCKEEISQKFMKMVEDEIECANKRPGLESYRGLAMTRTDIVVYLLFPFKSAHLFYFNMTDYPVDMDIFIFPPDWRERLPELQVRMRHGDPKFMANIAKDARRIA